MRSAFQNGDRFEERYMIVGCSTLCFSRNSLDLVFDYLTELDISRYEVVVHDHSIHLTPANSTSDPQRISSYLKQRPGISPAAFFYREIRKDSFQEFSEIRALASLARHCQIPLITVLPSNSTEIGSREVDRLAMLVQAASGEGIELAVSTQGGTWASIPEGLSTACRAIKDLSVALDPTHFPILDLDNSNQELILSRVAHVHVRDSGKGPLQFQTKVGRGHVEHGRILNLLERAGYQRMLSIDIHDYADSPFPVLPEVRKLKFLLESLL
ncbi:MAG: sugar phosphate isomerase/epimerase family protein [Planctomycetota bacterium]